MHFPSPYTNTPTYSSDYYTLLYQHTSSQTHKPKYHTHCYPIILSPLNTETTRHTPAITHTHLNTHSRPTHTRITHSTTHPQKLTLLLITNSISFWNKCWAVSVVTGVCIGFGSRCWSECLAYVLGRECLMGWKVC